MFVKIFIIVLHSQQKSTSLQSKRPIGNIQDQIVYNYNIVYWAEFASLTVSNKTSVLLSNQIACTFEENSFQSNVRKL